MKYNFYHRGSIENPLKQEKVLQLAAKFWADSIPIQPTPNVRYETKRFISWEETKTETYPFDFYGIFHFRREDAPELGQMVFDRTDEGRLVGFSKLPDSYGSEAVDPEERDLTDFDVSVRSFGFTQTNHIHAFALLLYLVKHRYCLTLRVFDQEGVYEEMEYLVTRLLLADAMWDENLDFHACKALFDDAYEKEYGMAPGDHGDSSVRIPGFKPIDRENAWRLFLMDFIVPNPIISTASFDEVASVKLNAEELQNRTQKL